MKKAKKKRKLSAYNLFTKECMDMGKSMKECAVEWKSVKGTEKEKKLAKEAEKRNKTIEEDAGEGSAAKNLEGVHIDIGDYDKVMLITSEGCPACEDWKDAFKPLIESGMVKLADVQHDDDAVDAAIELGLSSVPAVVGVKKGKYEKIV